MALNPLWILYSKSYRVCKVYIRPRLAPGTKAEQIGAVETIALIALSRPATTGVVTRGTARLMIAMGYAPLLEVGLPNGRRADVMALGPKGQIVVCEVKSSLEDFRADRKWGEYLPYCDAFYFAVPPEFPTDVLPGEPGLIVADGFGGAVARPARQAALAPARRKALTVAFARLAAWRTGEP